MAGNKPLAALVFDEYSMKLQLQNPRRPRHIRKLQIFQSLEHFLETKEIPSGNLLIRAGLPIQMYWENRGSDITLVTFSGAATDEVKELPFYTGFRVTKSLKCNVLLISDPALFLEKSLKIGWYAGSVYQENFQSCLAQIVRHLQPANSRLVFFGLSGGGFAALDMGLRFDRSVVIAVNPQTAIGAYVPAIVSGYLDTCWNGATLKQLADRGVRVSVVDGFSQQIETRIVYVQNSGDMFHERCHLKPLKLNLHEDNKFLLLSEFFGDGHVGPDKDTIKQLLTRVTEIENWPDLFVQLNQMKLTNKKSLRRRLFATGRQLRLVQASAGTE